MKDQITILNYKAYILLICIMAALVGCRNEMDNATQLRLSLCIPIQNEIPAQRRVLGDPGTTEHFELPKYAYIFVMKNVGGTWSVWKKEELVLAPEDWKRTRYVGYRATLMDSIYKYNKPIEYLLNNETPEGRVYAVCSNKKLEFYKAFDDVSNLEDVLNWKFNSFPDSIQANLQNIFTTPYNYIVGDDYYCAFDCNYRQTSFVDLILYHIAAKVDLQWSVQKDVRIKPNPAEAVRLTYLEARRLFDGFCFCFKPMRNTLSALATEGAEIKNIVTEQNEGLWWEGRSYFYTIPYTVTGEPDYFPLQLLMRTNDSTGTGYQLTLKQPIDTTDVFVPWFRGDILLTKPLEDKSETKIIPN